MIVIGLTGGIASGKSVIAKELAKMPGVAVIDADRVAWECYQQTSDVYKKLLEHFGKGILRSDGGIDRKRLGEIVFTDEEELDFLSKTVHPAVAERVRRLAGEHKEKGTEILIIEAALLLQSAHADLSSFDYIVALKVDREEQIKRLMQRDEISREVALRKVESQASGGDRLAEADYIIDTKGSEGDTITQAKKLFAAIKEQGPRRRGRFGDRWCRLHRCIKNGDEDGGKEVQEM